MRKRIHFIIALFQVLAIAVGVASAQSNQIDLSFKELEKHTYYFDVVDGQMIGDGAKFLTNEINKSQFVMLGEYHDSLRVSQFTKALIPIFHNAGGRTLALEVGPVSVEILNELAKNPAQTIENLHAFNTRYQTPRNRGESRFPIPFFKHVEDAEFLAEATGKKWNLLGLDQEFIYGYAPLVDRMYTNLGNGKKRELKSLYEQAANELKKYYELDSDDGKGIENYFSESKKIAEFLDAAAKNNPKNQRIAEALRTTNNIYLDNTNRQYYKTNSDRINYMKKNLAEQLTKIKFDLAKDKMLVKMGAIHMARGFSLLSLYEIGSTLSELAEYHSNKAVNLRFDSRYAIEKGKEVDVLEKTERAAYTAGSLLQMAKKDRWTVIDLRPLREAVFYWRRYKLNDAEMNVFKTYDLYVVPKQEAEPRFNIAFR